MGSSCIGLLALCSLTSVMLQGVALTGSKGGKVGSGPISVTLILGILNGARAGGELVNVELEYEHTVMLFDGEVLGCIDCAKTLATKAGTNNTVSKPIVIVFLIFFHHFVVYLSF